MSAREGSLLHIAFGSLFEMLPEKDRLLVWFILFYLIHLETRSLFGDSVSLCSLDWLLAKHVAWADLRLSVIFLPQPPDC